MFQFNPNLSVHYSLCGFPNLFSFPYCFSLPIIYLLMMKQDFYLSRYKSLWWRISPYRSDLPKTQMWQHICRLTGAVMLGLLLCCCPMTITQSVVKTWCLSGNRECSDGFFMILCRRDAALWCASQQSLLVFPSTCCRLQFFPDWGLVAFRTLH